MEEALKKNIVIFSLGLMFSGLVGGLTLINFIGFELVSKSEMERIKEEKNDLKSQNEKLKDMLVEHRIAMVSWGKIKSSDVNTPLNAFKSETDSKNRSLISVFKDYWWLFLIVAILIASVISAIFS